MKKEAEDIYDVVIIGAGLAGLTLALQLKKASSAIDVCVIEKKDFPLAEGLGTVGESTVEVASHYLGKILDLEQHLEESQFPKLGLRYFLESSENAAIENRLEVGGNKYAPTPSYQIDRARLENHLAKELERLGVRIESLTTVKDVRFEEDSKEVEVSSSENIRSVFRAKWLVDASGRTNVLKKRLELKENLEHQGSSAWWRFHGEFKIDDWCQESSWQSQNSGETARWFSTNHLMGEGYWVWIIPLVTGLTSFGIVADPAIHPFETYNTYEKAVAWLQKYEPQLGTLCQENSDKLQDFAAMKNYALGCQEVFSEKRWALTGEAGVFIDPFYSPGSDFIAIANTYIADLIQRDLAGESIALRASLYNNIFLKIARSTISTFKGQYSILGNPLVLPIKVYWDWCFYWQFIARLFFENKLNDLRFVSRANDIFLRFEVLGEEMQGLFRHWNTLERPSAKAGFLDLGRHPFLFDLNGSLSIKHDPKTFGTRFESGLQELETIAAEIIEIFEARTGEVFERSYDSEAKPMDSIIGPFLKDLEGFIHAD